MDYSKYKALKLDLKDRVLTVTLDNPPMNAFTDDMHREMAGLFHDVNQDEGVAVVVVTGAGKGFSAGGDLKLMKTRIEAGDHRGWITGIKEARLILQGLLALNKPLIARINGHAMGMGATLAAFADISFMSKKARIADTHVLVGLAAGDGGSLLWPLVMGVTRAKRFLLTGEALTAEMAEEFGLITYAVEPEELDARVDAMVAQLASGATQAINATKVCINLVLRNVIEPLIEAHLGLESEAQLSKDHKEAVDAFVEGRKPAFTGL